MVAFEAREEREKIMTTLAVIAANGRAGRAFVLKALDAGYEVRAGYHAANNLPSHERMTAISCDATNEEDVRTLLSGADVVVSLIGHVKQSPPNIQTDSMKVIAKVMNDIGINRIISLTGTGVRFPGDTPSIIDRLLNIAIKYIDPARIKDGIRHVEYLQSTNLDWTILRVLKLINSAEQKPVYLSPAGPAELLTSRDRVASAILKIIEEGGYIKSAPIVVGKQGYVD